jgi:hypothetical protein
MQQHEAVESSGETAAAIDGAKRFAAWNIIERKPGEKAIWHKVGVGFVNRDGSINVHLDSIPFQGKIQLRDDKDLREQEKPWQRRARPAPSDEG